MKKILIAAILVLAFAFPASAVEWVKIGGDIQIDKDTIKRSADGSQWAVWMKYRNDDGGYCLARLGIQPGGEKVWVEVVISFDNNNNLLKQVDFKEWMPAVPGSRLEYVQRFITEVEKDVQKNAAPAPQFKGEVEQ